MGKQRAIQLETRRFEKAGDGLTFFRAMLNRYAIGSTVSAVDSADLMALLKRHDQIEDKIGTGVNHFVVDAAPDGYKGKCFWVMRLDGSRMDFSFKHCLEARPHD